MTVQFPAGLQRCLNALYGPHKPMTDAERAEHESRCAAEQARAEARRKPTPQPDLLDQTA